MDLLKKAVLVLSMVSFLLLPTARAHAEVIYVTDAGGCAYDEARACTNLAPAIALATVVLVAIIAVAIQNSHEGSSSHYYYSHFCDSRCSSSSYDCCDSSSFSSGSYYFPSSYSFARSLCSH